MFGRFLDWRAVTPITLIAILFLNLTAVIKYWGPIKARQNERLRDIETQKDGDWTRLRAEINRLDTRCADLEARCDHLQKEVDECRERENEWRSRATAAEAYQVGQGNSRQEVAVLESAKRIVEGKKK